MAHPIKRPPTRTLRRLSRGVSGLLCLLILSGCESHDGTGEWYTNWDLAGGCTSDSGGDTRPSGAGTAVNVCERVAEQPWIWVVYAAPWCNASQSQAQQIRALQQNASAELAVYTVLTSGQDPFSPATVSQARSWASRYGLDAHHVLAEESTRTIPQHLLIGPDGRTFYRYVGFLSEGAINEVLGDFREGIRVPNVRELPRP
ncbi:TlpA family protein disulfide reductase [Halochromatium roseum]|uniref:TlpA family protein disulfide reductase n=1 Tax=Halochromatium roseum TaxID=391920 RepID=UPI0019125061|nr:hypothetical protein [Halochromatium roseum]